MLVSRSALVAAASASLLACADPDQPTDLRTHGPPDVTTVLVASDLRTSIDPDFPAGPLDLDRLIETATYCRIGDDKRPAVVNLPTITTYRVCPDDLSQKAEQANVAPAAPPTWYARVVFDELLDPTIEDLVPELDAMMRPTGRLMGTLRATQPVVLTCDGAAVPYDGYYVPNGNRISWPVGPALFIQPLDATAVATGAVCELAIKDNVHNKRGESVPTDQRSYAFQVAAMALRFSDPSTDGDPGMSALAPDAPVSLFFTAAIGALPAASRFHVFAAPNLAGDAPDLALCDGDGNGAAVPAADLALAIRAPDPDASAASTAATTALVLELGLDSAAPARWAPSTTYRIEVAPGTTVAAHQGGAPATFPDGFSLCFHTTAAAPVR